jgi:Zn-dependent peptidase ImmA (M78 family)/transcriptional regulator with XRE-family HTH domain
MMTGTPGFYGERLLEVREARGLTALQLGELIGVTKQAVNMYEKSRCSPSPETLERIVQVLRVPTRYFLRQPAPEHRGPIFYRSMTTATNRMRTRAERKMGWVREILTYLSHYVELPEISIPNIGPPADPTKITDEMVEDAASTVRQHWALGEAVISNVTLLLENNGIVASRFALEAAKLDSFSLWDDYTGRPLLILGEDKQSAVRSRFDAAHELAHLVLHRNVPVPVLHHKPTQALLEEQAHRFGRAFLLPSRSFARDFALPTLHALKNLKPKWKASIGLMIKRAEELDLISAEQANRLWVNRSRQGWNRREPYDDELEPEYPVLMARSIRLLIESNTVNRSRIEEEIALSADDIEALTCLPHGFLSEQGTPTAGPEPRLLPFHGEEAG